MRLDDNMEKRYDEVAKEEGRVIDSAVCQTRVKLTLWA